MSRPSAVPVRAPWQLATKGILDPATAFKFELYDLSKDWTQTTDVAAANPRRVQEMRDLMFGEFAKYQVLPLDGSAATRFATARPSAAAGRTMFTYSGATVSIPNGNQPSLLNTSYTITADIDVPQGGAEGVIVGEGGRFAGYSLPLARCAIHRRHPNPKGLVRFSLEAYSWVPAKGMVTHQDRRRHHATGDGECARNWKNRHSQR